MSRLQTNHDAAGSSGLALAAWAAGCFAAIAFATSFTTETRRGRARDL